MYKDTSVARRIFASFDGNDQAATLPGLCRRLLLEQKASWEKLAAGYAALDSVLVRELQCNGFSAKLQFNPARIVSTGAPVDKKAIDKRPCFLCPENLPEAQYGVLYREEFLILCNPYPIFPEHFTVSHIRHLPQSLAGVIPTFLTLAGDFGPDFRIFYNGPKSGASAPDHLHFQAAPGGMLPIEKEITNSERKVLVKRAEGASLFRIENVGREVIVLEGEDYNTVSASLMNIIEAMKMILSTTEDPLNMMCSYTGNVWQVVIFPRKKLRPDVYYLPRDERILVSPGLVDMGGVIITPLERNFTGVDEKLIRHIYEEVSVDAETMQKILAVVSI